jgi:hypothetical protein
MFTPRCLLTAVDAAAVVAVAAVAIAAPFRLPVALPSLGCEADAGFAPR